MHSSGGRAVALAQHYRYADGLSIGQIADRLGRSPATVKAYFYDPTGEKARAVKSGYVGVCRGCGAYTQAAERQGRCLRVLQAVLTWRDRAQVGQRSARATLYLMSSRYARQLARRAGATVECGGRCSIETGVLGDRADHDRRHGRLPFDRTLTCGCWYEEGAVVLALTRRGAADQPPRTGPIRGRFFRPHGSISHIR